MNWSKLQEIVKDKEACCAAVHGWQKVRHDLETAAAKSLQSCPTLCDPIDGSPPGSSVPLSLGFSRQEYRSGLPFPSPMHACMLNHLSLVRLCVTLWTAAHQAPPSTGFSRQEYWSGVPLLPVYIFEGITFH